ncbi:MAG: hypothetical protein KF766_01595 [Rhodocyclaceae bacterium]|nr:hypothetical protein [Rhodocyclaceae bacterium]
MSDRAFGLILSWAIVLAFVFGNRPAVAQDNSSWRWSGEYKNLLLNSKTVSGERYSLDENRIRLKLKGMLGEAATIDLQYDNQVLVGSYLRTRQFQQQKASAQQPYWSLDSNYLDQPSIFGRHALYRASINFVVGETDIRIGRQRIAWGTGRFWSPLDILNPVSTITLDRSERQGVDAVLVEHKLGPLSRVAAVFAPSPIGGNSTRAFLWHSNVRGVDYSIVGGRFGQDDVLGFDIAGQISQAAVRGEWTRVRTRADEHFNRALVGLDYAFQNTLTLSAELYRDESGASNPGMYDFSAQTNGQRQTLARNYLGVQASYDFTPLTKWSSELVINLVDQSWYFAPAITYSVYPNLDWSFGVQLFGGITQSEFVRHPDVAYTQLRWYF